MSHTMRCVSSSAVSGTAASGDEAVVTDVACGGTYAKREGATVRPLRGHEPKKLTTPVPVSIAANVERPSQFQSPMATKLSRPPTDHVPSLDDTDVVPRSSFARAMFSGTVHPSPPMSAWCTSVTTSALGDSPGSPVTSSWPVLSGLWPEASPSPARQSGADDRCSVA